MTITVFVPPRFHGTAFQEMVSHNDKRNLVTRHAYVRNGRHVVDLTLHTLKAFLLGSNGLDWQRENPEVMERFASLREGDVVFPGENRPPPPEEVRPEPSQVRLRAPEGVTSYSHDGTEHQIGNDRTITVASDLADMLRSHGFKDAA